MCDVSLIRSLDVKSLNFANYAAHLADCIILGADGQIVLQLCRD